MTKLIQAVSRLLGALRALDARTALRGAARVSLK
jgi:hypothetical protein